MKTIKVLELQFLALVIALSSLSCSTTDENDELPTILNGDLKISSLADLNDPKTKNYISINGNLIIRSFDQLTDLRGLSNLQEITGGILINDNVGLQSLKGLENIRSLEFLEIESNEGLTALTGLESLAAVASNLRIDNNDQLESLMGLRNLASIGEQFTVFDNRSLVDLNGLENLKQAQEVILLNNISLASIKGLEGITSAESISILSNDSLTDFCALSIFLIRNQETVTFSTGFNSYNPSKEDLLNSNCSK